MVLCGETDWCFGGADVLFGSGVGYAQDGVKLVEDVCTGGWGC